MTLLIVVSQGSASVDLVADFDSHTSVGTAVSVGVCVGVAVGVGVLVAVGATSEDSDAGSSLATFCEEAVTNVSINAIANAAMNTVSAAEDRLKRRYNSNLDFNGLLGIVVGH